MLQDRDHFRRTAARFATGVTVVTCGKEPSLLHGMTANSFISVSLDPPTVLLSMRAGRMLDLIRTETRYAINVLGSEGKALSHHFSGRPALSSPPELAFQNGVPILQEAIASFVCELGNIVEIQDHSLVIGSVVHCEHRTGSPLVFFRSEYFDSLDMDEPRAGFIAAGKAADED